MNMIRLLPILLLLSTACKEKKDNILPIPTSKASAPTEATKSNNASQGTTNAPQGTAEAPNPVATATPTPAASPATPAPTPAPEVAVDGIPVPPSDKAAIKKTMKDLQDSVNALVANAKALGANPNTLYWITEYTRLLNEDVQVYTAGPTLEVYVSLTLQNGALSLHLGALADDPKAKSLLNAITATNQKCLDLRTAVGTL